MAADNANALLNMVALGVPLIIAAERCGIDYAEAFTTLKAALRTLSAVTLGTDDMRLLQLRKLQILQDALANPAAAGSTEAAALLLRCIDTENRLLGLTSAGYQPTTAQPAGGDLVDELRTRRADRRERR
jgi:hypothetical protein